MSLREILADLQDKESVWFDLADCSASAAATLLEGEVNAITNPVSMAPNGIEIDMAALDPMLSLCEFCAAHFMDLALICYERADETEQLLWPGRDEANGSFVLEVLSINMANTLLAVRELSVTGFDLQARMLLRGFVEIADAAVACAYDYNFFVAFAKAEPDPDIAGRYWQRHLKPSKVREVLDKLSAEQGMSPDLTHTISALRRNTYHWLSNFSHIHPLGLAISGLASRIDDRNRLIPKFGRMRDAESRRTLAKASLYAWLTTAQLGWLLATTTHGWYALRSKGDNQRSWFSFRNEFIKRFLIHHYATIYDAATD